LSFDGQDQLLDLLCRDDGLTFDCKRPADEYVCSWSDQPDCGDVYDASSVLLGYFCGKDLDAHRNARADGGPTTDAGVIDSGGAPDGGAGLEWWTACGPPVCMPGTSQFAPCTSSQVRGERCTTQNERCRVGADDCSGVLECSDVNPIVGACPISKREFKRDIRYLNDSDTSQLLDELIHLKLTRYVYKQDQQAREQLGFIIDDGVPDTLLSCEGDRVNLYSYTSLAVASLQAQQKEIARLERELDALRSRVDAFDRACYPSP
jgi:hypothetical protein